MSITNALYKFKNIREEVTLTNIVNHAHSDTVKEHLYCTSPNCNVRIIYVPKGKHRAYFKVWPNEQHDIDCIYYSERKEILSRTSSQSIENRISSEHKAKALKSIYKESLLSDAERQKLKEQQRAKSRAKSIVNKRSQKNSVIAINPTTDPKKDEIPEGTREPPIRKIYSINDLGPAHVGKLINLVEKRAIHIYVQEKNVVLQLTTPQKTCNVHFEESFFASAPVNMERLFRNVKSYLDSPNIESITFAGIGRVVERNDQIGFVISTPEDFILDGLPIETFVLTQ